MRSLFSRLHRRFGRRATGSELARRVDLHRQRLEAALPLRTLQPRRTTGAQASISVLVAGGGFAGAAAAYTLAVNGFSVTLAEPNSIGGRVNSSTSVATGRTIERGAELIGLNHPTWILFAEQFGLGLSLFTSDDMASATGLALPVQLDGRSYDDNDALALYEAMATVLEPWTQTAATAVPPELMFTPWLAPNAASLDQQSLAGQIPSGTPQAVADAIKLSFYLDNTVDPANQSWLSNLAQISAGSSGVTGSNLDFFADTEVFRCDSGNQSLAQALVSAASASSTLTQTNQAVTALDVAAGGGSVTATLVDSSNTTVTQTFDYVIVTIPGAMLSKLPINGDPVPSIAYGPAVKYLAPTDSRFWLPRAKAPLGFSDQIGMTWEGTDNQIGSGQVELSVFAGGQVAANALAAASADTFFQGGLQQLFGTAEYVNAKFVAWPDVPYIGMGYSCPALGEVTTKQKALASPLAGRIYFAGEHVSPPWFGFMEGALQTGVAAAQQLIGAV